MRNEVLESKKAVIAEIQEKLKNSSSAVIVEYRGLEVSQMTELRRQLRAEGVELKVYKNSMFQRAVEGTDYEALKPELVGPNAVAFGEDAVAPSRVLANFAKKNKALVLKVGIVDGHVVGHDEIQELSALPNHDGMIAMLLGMFQSPVRSFAYAVSQVALKREAEGEVTEAKPETAPVETETKPEETTVAAKTETSDEVKAEAAPAATEGVEPTETEPVAEAKEAAAVASEPVEAETQPETAPEEVKADQAETPAEVDEKPADDTQSEAESNDETKPEEDKE